MCSHSSRESRSSWSRAWSCWSLILLYRRLSSAKSLALECWTASGRSLIYVKKRRGPRTVFGVLRIGQLQKMIAYRLGQHKDAMFIETELHSKVLWARPSKLHSFATRTTFALRPHIRNHSLISWPEEFALLTTQKKTCQHNHSRQIHRDRPHSSTTVWARKLSATTKRQKVYQEQTVKKKKKQEEKKRHFPLRFNPYSYKTSSACQSAESLYSLQRPLCTYYVNAHMRI